MLTEVRVGPLRFPAAKVPLVRSRFGISHLRAWPDAYIWWTRWCAVQLITSDPLNEWLRLGFNVEATRPLLDVFLGPLTLAFGRHPVLTDDRDRFHSSRRFIRGERVL